MIKFLTLRQCICPLSLFLKEIQFASLTNAIDVKIERVLTGFLIGWTKCMQYNVWRNATKQNQSCVQSTYPDKYNQTKPVETITYICNFFTFICHSCLYWHCTYLLKQYINIIRFNYQTSLMQIIVCLVIRGHEISIKSIFDFRCHTKKRRDSPEPPGYWK